MFRKAAIDTSVRVEIPNRPQFSNTGRACTQVTVVGDLHGQLFDFDHMLGLAGARLSLLGSLGFGFRCAESRL